MNAVSTIAPGLHPSWAEVNTAGWRWPHFTAQELSCKCRGRHCRGEYFHDPDFLDALERLRGAVDRPLKLNSGRRCEGHNRAEGGASRSQHALRIAGDISLAGHDRTTLARLAVAAGFTGIGFGRTFLHVDMRRESRTAWNYSALAKAPWIQAFGFDPVARLKARWTL